MNEANWLAQASFSAVLIKKQLTSKSKGGSREAVPAFTRARYLQYLKKMISELEQQNNEDENVNTKIQWPK